MFQQRTPRGLFVLALSCLCILGAFEAHAQFTPLEWQSKEPPPWNRDENRNRIDDLIEKLKPSDKIDIVIDLRVCLSESDVRQLFGAAGDSLYRGKFVSFVFVKNVLVSTAMALAGKSQVAMVELAEDFKALNNTSVRAVKVRASAAYSPNTVQDAFPTITGSGVNIAILDTGVDDTHESFTGKFVAGYNAFTAVATNPDDDNGHGTHVAGTALGTGGASGTFRGVASGAGLVDVKVLSAGGTGSWAVITDGLEWVIANHATYNIKVVNMSLGGGSSNGIDAFSQVVNYAVAQGITVVVAAGNSGTCAGFGRPAAASLAITVAAAEINGTVTRTDDVIADFSARGPRASDFDGDPRDELKPEITAPGAYTATPSVPNCIPSCSICTTGITSAQFNTTSSYTNSCFCGTSMAAPHVAGIAALIIQRYPSITPGAVKDLLIRTAEDIDPTADMPGVDPVWNSDWGYGYVDAFEALNTSPVTDVKFFSHPPPVSWLSPDLWTATYPPVAGIPNTIFAKIRNNGPNPAFGVKVDFGVKDFSAAISTFYEIATQVVDIPAMTTMTLSQAWIPMASTFTAGEAHACLKAEISYGLDTDFSNNNAQRNITIKQTASPATFQFVVDNVVPKTTTARVQADTTDVPPGWKVAVNPAAFTLEPFTCSQIVEIILTPPVGAKPGDLATVNVAAVAGNQILGGVTAQAIVPRKGSTGDINGDDKFNSTDALVLLSYEVGGIQIPLDFPVKCGDVNKDGKINSTDALIILSYDAGIKIPFDLGGTCP